MTPSPKHGLRVLLGVCAFALLLPLPVVAAGQTAAAKPACWRTLMNDWFHDGVVNKVYPTPCYREAIKHLPSDIQNYSSAREDINRALQAAIAKEKNPNAPAPTTSTTTTTTTTASTTTTTTAKTTTTTPAPVAGGAAGGGGGGGAAKGPTTPQGPTNQPGPIPQVINDSSPGGATSFPLPLIILGGLALLLLAAGAVGLIIRRGRGPGPA